MHFQQIYRDSLLTRRFLIHWNILLAFDREKRHQTNNIYVSLKITIFSKQWKKLQKNARIWLFWFAVDYLVLLLLMHEIKFSAHFEHKSQRQTTDGKRGRWRWKRTEKNVHKLSSRQFWWPNWNPICLYHFFVVVVFWFVLYFSFENDKKVMCFGSERNVRAGCWKQNKTKQRK